MNVELACPVMRPTHCLTTWIIVGALGASVPRAALAQSATPASASAPSACVNAAGPDSGTTGRDSVNRLTAPRAGGDMAQHAALRLFAAVQAEEVRFAQQPTICVTMRGDARLDSVRVLARRNLASPVVRGTTYRDVYVAVEILGHLDAECISSRITGAAAGAGTGACASLGVRDSASARRAGAPPQ